MSDKNLEQRIIQLEQQQQEYILFTFQALRIALGSDDNTRNKALDALRKIIQHASKTPQLSPGSLQLLQMLRSGLIDQGTDALDQLYNQPYIRSVD